MRPEGSEAFSTVARPSSSDLTETISFDGDGDTFTSVTFPDLADGEGQPTDDTGETGTHSLADIKPIMNRPVRKEREEGERKEGRKKECRKENNEKERGWCKGR